MNTSAEPDRVLALLDPETRSRAMVLVDAMARAGELGRLDAYRLRWVILDTLPECAPAESWHDLVWALGDFFAAAHEPDLADVCRDSLLHAELAAVRQGAGYADLGFYAQIAAVSRPRSFTPKDLDAVRSWSEYVAGSANAIEPYLPGVLSAPSLPENLDLALAPLRGFLDVVADGVRLEPGPSGAMVLPLASVLALNDRFRWSDDLGKHLHHEEEVPQARILREHLQRQGVISVEGNVVRPTRFAERVWLNPAELWIAAHQTFAVPHDRQRDFERDSWGWFGAIVAQNPGLDGDLIVREVAALVSGRWTLAGVAGSRDVELVEAVRQSYQRWYAVGMVLGWWQRRRGRWLGTRTTSAGEAQAVLLLWSAAHGVNDRTRRPSLH